MLKITKKGDKYWLFEDSQIGLFSPSKFTINLLNNVITIVYENGLKSKNYNVIDCEIYDLGATSPFTTSSGNAFMQKLEELNCPCFQKNENIFNISGGAWGDITGNLSNQTDLQTALDSKLDKDTTAGVERAYIVNADGSQGTKATSEFKDVLEYANLISFPATGETSKIYLALDTNKTYRWSGSTYVQLSGGIDLYPIKYWYQATGTGFGTYGTNVMIFTGTQTDVFVPATGLSYRKLASAAKAGTSISAREASFGRVIVNKGYQFLLRFRISDASTISDVRGFHGLQVTTGFFNTDISANTQPMCGIGCDGTDTNIHIFSRFIVGSGTKKIDTGFAKTNNDEYLLKMERLPNQNDVFFSLTNLTTSTIFTYNIANNSSILTIVNHRNNNASNLSCGFEIQRQELNLSE